MTVSLPNTSRQVIGLSNWWRGCLPEYSSIYGFGAVWCLLNAHRPMEFARFIAEAYDTPVSRDLSAVPLHKAAPSQRLANSLGERRRVIQSMSPKVMYPPSFDQKALVVNGQWPYGTIMVCPNCWMRSSYHSIFHMREANDKCPLHQIELQELNPIEKRGCPPGGPKDLLLVETLLQHLQSTPFAQSSFMKSAERELDVQPLADFCRWITKQDRDVSGRLCCVDFGRSRTPWKMMRSYVYAIQESPPTAITKVLSESPYVGGVVERSWRINQEQYSKTAGIFEAVGFTRLLAMAWTTQVIKGFVDCATPISGKQLDPKLHNDHSAPFHSYSLSSSASVGLLSKACGRILFDSQFGYISQSGNGLVLYAYEKTAGILESLGVMTGGRATGQLIRYRKNKEDRNDGAKIEGVVGGWEIVSEHCGLPCFEFLPPWREMFNFICSVLISCELSEKTAKNENQEDYIRGTFDPAIYLGLTRDRLAARVFMRSVPSISVGPQLARWYKDSGRFRIEALLSRGCARKRWPTQWDDNQMISMAQVLSNYDD